MTSTIVVNDYEWIVDSAKKTVFVPKQNRVYHFNSIKELMNTHWKDNLICVIPELVKSKVLSKNDAKNLISRHWKDDLICVIPELVKSKTLNKADAKDLVKAKIGDSDALALQVLMTIYSYQTEHEKSAQRCSDYNGVGFSKFDVQILTSIAQCYKRKGKLSKDQKKLLAWKMPKYGRQFYEHLERMNERKEKSNK